MKIQRIAQGVNINPLLWAIQENPQLWNQREYRTKPADSPHHEVDDIWVRYACEADFGREGPHESVWYASAAPLVPLCQDLGRYVINLTRAERLGAVLITRIPAGKQCKPHVDGGWHATYYSTKVGVQVQSAPGQTFCFEDESLETRPGDVFTFDNSYTHWIHNPTEYDRITAIYCLRCEGV